MDEEGEGGGFLGDGFGVKEKKKAGTGGLCPTTGHPLVNLIGLN
jgi:hypothetical protein